MDALELEHVVGWTGRYPGTLHTHPSEDATYFAALGCAVVVGDVVDPHKQRFLRAHDAPVSALAVSATGRLLASGQQRSQQVATGDASVMVWDWARGVAVYTFHGLSEGILHVAFSPDERFLAAAGADNTLAVWDMTTGEQVRRRRAFAGLHTARARSSPRPRSPLTRVRRPHIHPPTPPFPPLPPPSPPPAPRSGVL